MAMFLVKSSVFPSALLLWLVFTGFMKANGEIRLLFKLCNQMAPAHACIFIGAVAGFGTEQPGRGVKKGAKSGILSKNAFYFL